MRHDSQVRAPSRRTVALFLIFVAALVVAVSLVVAQQRSTQSAETAAATAPAALPPALEVAIIGDSYSVGVGSTRNFGYTPLVCPELNWACRTDAQDGTGYTNIGVPSEGFTVYADRVRYVIDQAPGVVVVQGGTYDSDASEGRIRDAATEVFTRLRTGLPNARVIAVSTTAPPAIRDDRELRVQAGIRDAAAATGVTFIDPIAENWLQDGDYIAADRLHPTDEGYRKYADRWIEDMRMLGVVGPERTIAAGS